MAILLGDQLGHSNPIYSIVDVDDVRGGIRQVATFDNTSLTALFGTIPDKVKQGQSLLLDTTEGKLYWLSGMTATETSSWTLAGGGGGGTFGETTFNEFFTGFVKGGTYSLDSGWWKITDFRSTGYLLDRFQGGIYGASGATGNVVNTPIEPIIVRVYKDETTEKMTWEPKVVSTLYPQDEIYWTADWGIGATGTIDGAFLANDATLFGLNETVVQRWPLESIETGAFGITGPNRDFTPNSFIGFDYWRGFIYYRKDTQRNIEAGWDWRNVPLVRYDSSHYPNWVAGGTYLAGNIVKASDGFLYVKLIGYAESTTYHELASGATHNPIKYDIFTGATGYPNSTWDVPPGPYAPTSPRRIWQRLFPASYKWFSPWANGGSTSSQYIGLGQLGSNVLYDNLVENYPIQTEIFALNRHFVYALSGDGDSWSAGKTATNLTYIENVNLGTGGWTLAGPGATGYFDAINTYNFAGDVSYTIYSGLTPNKLLRITAPKFPYLKSRVSDNRIVVFDFIDEDYVEPDYVEPNFSGTISNERAGIVRNIQFETDSVGNTLYVSSFDTNVRDAWWSLMDNAYYGSRLNRGSQRRDYGFAFEYTGPNSTWEYSIGPTSNPYISENLPELTIKPKTIAHFSDVRFGAGSVGNTVFSAFMYGSTATPFIENWWWSEDTDGAFTKVDLQESRYNLFLGGINEFNGKRVQSCLFESCESVNIGTANGSRIRSVRNSDIGSTLFDTYQNLDDFRIRDGRFNTIDSVYHLKIGGGSQTNAFNTFANFSGFYYSNMKYIFSNNITIGEGLKRFLMYSGSNTQSLINVTIGNFINDCIINNHMKNTEISDGVNQLSIGNGISNPIHNLFKLDFNKKIIAAVNPDTETIVNKMVFLDHTGAWVAYTI